mmetsp:Transcript_43209/g.119489  ORF Transcript_43209/g.119489 Transcript_43209/m.119489 type:complete len:759 (+) Transcript_43209:76-2352(+)
MPLQRTLTNPPNGPLPRRGNTAPLAAETRFVETASVSHRPPKPDFAMTHAAGALGDRSTHLDLPCDHVEEPQASVVTRVPDEGDSDALNSSPRCPPQFPTSWDFGADASPCGSCSPRGATDAAGGDAAGGSCLASCRIGVEQNHEKTFLDIPVFVAHERALRVPGHSVAPLCPSSSDPSVPVLGEAMASPPVPIPCLPIRKVNRVLPDRTTSPSLLHSEADADSAEAVAELANAGTSCSSTVCTPTKSLPGRLAAPFNETSHCVPGGLGADFTHQTSGAVEENGDAVDLECWAKLHAQLRSLHEDMQEFVTNHIPPTVAPAPEAQGQSADGPTCRNTNVDIKHGTTYASSGAPTGGSASTSAQGLTPLGKSSCGEVVEPATVLKPTPRSSNASSVGMGAMTHRRPWASLLPPAAVEQPSPPPRSLAQTQQEIRLRREEALRDIGAELSQAPQDIEAQAIEALQKVGTSQAPLDGAQTFQSPRAKIVAHSQVPLQHATSSSSCALTTPQRRSVGHIALGSPIATLNLVPMPCFEAKQPSHVARTATWAPPHRAMSPLRTGGGEVVTAPLVAGDVRVASRRATSPLRQCGTIEQQRIEQPRFQLVSSGTTAFTVAPTSPRLREVSPTSSRWQCGDVENAVSAPRVRARSQGPTSSSQVVVVTSPRRPSTTASMSMLSPKSATWQYQPQQPQYNKPSPRGTTVTRQSSGPQVGTVRPIFHGTTSPLVAPTLVTSHPRRSSSIGLHRAASAASPPAGGFWKH